MVLACRTLPRVRELKRNNLTTEVFVKRRTLPRVRELKLHPLELLLEVAVSHPSQGA